MSANNFRGNNESHPDDMLNGKEQGNDSQHHAKMDHNLSRNNIVPDIKKKNDEKIIDIDVRPGQNLMNDRPSKLNSFIPVQSGVEPGAASKLNSYSPVPGVESGRPSNLSYSPVPGNGESGRGNKFNSFSPVPGTVELGRATKLNSNSPVPGAVELVRKNEESPDVSRKIGDVNATGVEILSHEQILMKEYGCKKSRKANIEKLLHKIEQLKENLRCDEATLSLLRKLFNSQRGMGNQKPSMHNSMQQQKQQGHKIVHNPPHMQQNRIQQPQVRSPVSLSPRVPNAPVRYRHEMGSQSNGPNSHQPVHRPQMHQEKMVPPKPTPEQKQHALKEAIRKQLQQTLQEIQPPTPPQVDWKVIPSVGSMDFITLVGLDEVVDSILEIGGKAKPTVALQELVPSNSRICSQCKVDFSHSWKYQETEDSKSSVFCNRCFAQSSKTAMKSKYVSRLKEVFSKALKQEQEIEEKMKADEHLFVRNELPKNNSPTFDSKNNVRHKGVKMVHTYPQGGHHVNPMKQRYTHSTHQPRQQQQYHQPKPRGPPVQNSPRWHPYHNPPGHYNEHHKVRHVGYVSSPQSPRYYVVHQPQTDKA